jgi:hypothetical protein
MDGEESSRQFFFVKVDIYYDFFFPDSRRCKDVYHIFGWRTVVCLITMNILSRAEHVISVRFDEGYCVDQRVTLLLYSYRVKTMFCTEGHMISVYYI